MFRFHRNAGFFHPAYRTGFKKNILEATVKMKMMPGEKQPTTNKGGRPKKAIKQNQFIGVRCSLAEKAIIRQKAKSVHLTMSEFLRESGLNGQAVSKTKVLPREVLNLTTTLNQLAANMNQVAKKRNQHDELNTIERAQLTVMVDELKNLAIDIKKYLQ